MKKAMSILLVVLALAGVLAPAALAVDIVAKEEDGTVEPARPLLMYKDDVYYLSFAATAGKEYCWELRDPLYVVSFCPVLALTLKPVYPDTPTDLHTTIGNQQMRITAHAEGNNWVDLYEITRDTNTGEITTKALIASIQLNVQMREAPPPDPPDFWTIIKIWWNDLQYTWYYQIHPAVKFGYYTAVDWLTETWNMFTSTIRGWFDVAI